MADSAMLVLSELLTNAGRHARVSPGREIETRFVPVQDGPRIEVHDASAMPPEEQDPDVDACEGRGLLLVRSLSDAWGFGERNGPGKVVRAELRLGPSPGSGDDDDGVP
ncbi:ATP-binding protein [Streptomyces sp. NPDC059783]|uniref:ATP-binding protein n=1 Tax=Streptomyces sp. NPDC059783 TaxID=3346944 RepID=UPI00364ACD5D